MIGVFVPGVIQTNNNMLIHYFMNFLPDVIGDELKVIDFFKTNKMKNELEEKVDTFDIPLNDIVGSCSDWNQIAKEFDKYLEEGMFTTFICYKSLMDQSFLKFGLEANAIKHLKRAYDEPTRYMNYVSMQKKIAWLVFIDRCAKQADHFYQYVTDPQEADFGKIFDFKDFRRLYYNKAARTGSVLMPFYEYMLDKDSGEELEKLSPFTFFCSAVTESRHYIADMQEELENVDDWDVNIGTSDSKHRYQMIRQDEYFYSLKQSSTSLVIRPYDLEAFSWTRFCECLYNDCVPLVWNDCNFQDVETIFPEAIDFVKKNLLVGSIDELKQKVDEYDGNVKARHEAIDILKSAICKKHVLDIEWLRKRWQKLPGLKEE